MLPDMTSALKSAMFPTSLYESDADGVEDLPSGGILVKNLKIFRTGTFRDSLGRQHTWTAEDLQAMANHFELLRRGGLFMNVPVRIDHSFSMKNVVGYFAGVRADESFLYGDLEILRPDAVTAYKAKLLRARSLEVGPYITNDDTEFAPCTLGLAFVDIGAVEGLYRAYRQSSDYTPMADKEMTDMPMTDAEVQWVQAACYAKGLEDAPKPLPPDKPAPRSHTFSLRGGETTDFAKVQAELDALYGQQDQAAKVARTNYVASLVTDKKLGASLKEKYTKYVEDMSVEQFEQFKQLWDEAPEIPALGLHNLGGPNGNGREVAPDADNRTPEQKEIDKHEGIVAQHRLGGMSEEDIKKTSSYVRLTELRAAAAATAK